MAAFVPSVSLQQSADGSTIVITDTSNYGSGNSEGVTLSNILSRQDTVIDGLNNIIQVVTFAPNALTATITITADAYLNNSLAFIIADGSSRFGTDNFLAANFYQNKAREVSRKLRGCANKNLCNAAVKANLSYNEAVTATLFGVPSEAQNAITDANTLINSDDCGC